jgi:membrane-bound lytic murein transglycosylase A
VALVLLSSCEKRLQLPTTPETALVRIESDQVPFFTDDMDEASLIEALNQSKAYFLRLPQDTLINFGPDRYSTAHLVDTLDYFLSIQKRHLSPKEFQSILARDFTVYACTGLDGQGSMLFTGYYEPVVPVSRTRTDVYSYPIYRIPDDLIALDLSAFNVTCDRNSLVGRIAGSRFIPYYSRKEIDGDGVLEGRNLEIAWARSPIDVFFLHIQGSGILRFHEGDYVRVGYESQNGMAYRSIGKLLIEQGKISRENMSMQAIKKYLQEHPEEAPPILFTNPSYVFFKETEGGPYGNIRVTLTPGRSAATDARLFPKGALVFMESRKPALDDKDNIVSWQPFARFGCNQDTGGAIAGPGRVDLFWGNGSFAEIAAGYMKEKGRLYFLVLKKPLSQIGG